MYTIGQVSEMFGLPISTLRYYDKQGLFPEMERVSGIRKFSDYAEIQMLVYEQAIQDGSEDRVQSMIPDRLPAEIRQAYENAHKQT